MDYASLSGEFHSRLTQVPPTYLLQTTQVRSSRVLVYSKADRKDGQKWCGGRGLRTMGIIGGYSCKITSRKYAMEQLPMDYVCPTKNWTRSLDHLPDPYPTAMMRYRKMTQKQSILFLWTWALGIDKYWWKWRRAKDWSSSSRMESGGGKWCLWGP